MHVSTLYLSDRILVFHLQFFFSKMLNQTIQCCLFLSLISVTLKTKTDQDGSAWGTEGLVLTDVGSAKSNGFDSQIS